MAEEQIYLTQEGADKLRAELDELVNVKRSELADKLREARAMGDLSENADYIDAKEQQAFLEGRIKQLEFTLRHADVVSDDAAASGQVRIGSRVTVVEEDFDETETYLIVGTAESNPVEGKISHESPLGKALMGHAAGDTVSYQAPVGELRFTIKSIE
jgi:transcription elongation factor GreA